MTDDPGTRYAAAMRRLAEAAVGYDHDRELLHRRYAAQVSAAGRAVDRAAAEEAAAEEGMRAARALADQVNADAEGAWYGALSLVPGRRAARAEALPAPADVDLDTEVRSGESPERTAGPARAVAVLLSEALELVTQVSQRRTPTGRDRLSLAALGAAAALVGYALARSALAVGQHSQTPVGLVCAAAGRITAVISPFFGVAPLKWYLDRGAIRLGPGVVAVVVLGGLLAVAAAAALRPVTGI
jgi:hypothetical protein